MPLSPSPHPADLPFLGSHDAYGVTVNSISPERLFEMYEKIGFLYPAKLARLRPYLPLVLENWRRSMDTPPTRSLHQVLCFQNRTNDAFASVSFWRTLTGRSHSQHLVSQGIPVASRQVLLAAQAAELANRSAGSSENWFRVENRFPARVFGTCPDALGPESAALAERQVVAMPRGSIPPPSLGAQVEACAEAEGAVAHAFLCSVGGAVWAAAEELDRGDICLDALDERYRGVGLRRYRRVFLARLAGRDEPVGMAIAYRGPLGLNFSFLENRCDLVLDPALGETEYGAAVRSLVHAAASIYADFELPFLLLTTDDRASGVLVGGGGTVVQRYSRCIWLRSGFAAWYRHVDGFYTKVMALQERKAERAARNAPDTSGPPS